MNDSKLSCPEQIRAFLENSTNINFSAEKSDRYEWIAKKLKETGYFCLKKRDKSTVREYLMKVTGYSRQQLTRLIAQYKTCRRIGHTRSKRSSFPVRYVREDILLLAKTDEAHQTMSGPATKKLFERAYTLFDDSAYERLSTISVSHIYNLRKSNCYQQRRHHFSKTKPTSVKIGERRKPNPNGTPGFIRIDTVHQGDQDKKKGVYHINAVDEVTQFEVVCSVEKISEMYLIPVLEELLSSFPFKVLNFHSDNGSEYINKVVAKLLNKLQISLTKSRSRKTNDNALIESKNGSVVRKYLGYVHIPQRWAPLLNDFNKNHLTPYLNFHRPCYFPEIKIDKKGKERKTYPYEAMMTPYEKLKSLPNAAAYLRSEVNFDHLDSQAKETTDLEAAVALNKAREKLFQVIFSNEQKTH